MRKKILSLALALAMCLGLTIPVFATKTYTGSSSWDDHTCSVRVEGSTLYISYAGSGELTNIDFDELCYEPLEMVSKEAISEGVTDLSAVSISVGPGLTITDDFIAYMEWVIVDNAGNPVPVTFNKSTTPTQPQQPAGNATASPTNDKLEVNGNAADPTVYKIGGSNYFKIRDVAALLDGTEKQFSVGYDGEKNAVTATTGQGYEKQSGDLAGAAKGGNQAAAASNDAIYVNGEKITAEVYKINGSNYFKLRDLGKALDFYVGWSADRGMYIETGKPYSE